MSVIQELVSKLGFEVDDHALHGLHSKIEGIAESVKTLVGITIAEKIFELGERFAGFGEHLESAAIQAGLTAEELQKLQYAASQNAISADELSGGMSRLGRVLYQAQKGSKGAAETFAKLGIDEEQLKSFDNVKDALYAVQDGMANLGTQQEKLAVIQQLFGRGGAKFLKFMQIGSKATEEFGNEAERVGAIVSTHDIENLANFEDKMSSLGQVVKSFFATVAGTFAPALTKAIKALQDAWANNRGVVTEGLKRLAYLFGYYMGIAIVIIKELSATVHDVIYGQGGIVGAVKGAAEQVWATISSLFAGFLDLVQQANKDGSISAAFKSQYEFIASFLKTIGSLITSLGQAFDAFGKLFGVDTTKISFIAQVFERLAQLITLSFQGLTKISDWFNFALQGGFGDMLGESLFGDAGKGKGLKSARNVVGPAAVAGFASGFAVPAAIGAPNVAMMPQAGGQAAQTTVSVSSPITVNAAPGMDEKALADMVSKQQGAAMVKALNEAERDHSYGHLR